MKGDRPLSYRRKSRKSKRNRDYEHKRSKSTPYVFRDDRGSSMVLCTQQLTRSFLSV